MTDKQPKALLLADLLDATTFEREAEDELAKDAAAELRRLHTSEREGWRYADELEQERKRLESLAKAQGENNGG